MQIAGRYKISAICIFLCKTNCKVLNIMIHFPYIKILGIGEKICTECSWLMIVNSKILL
jgi:hypothetical protein